MITSIPKYGRLWTTKTHVAKHVRDKLHADDIVVTEVPLWSHRRKDLRPLLFMGALVPYPKPPVVKVVKQYILHLQQNGSPYLVVLESPHLNSQPT